MAARKFADWAINLFTLPDGASTPSVVDPGTTKQESGWTIEKPQVSNMNWILNLIGHYSRANNEFKIEADTYEAEAGEIVNMDNSAAAVTGYLPASPLDGQWVAFGGVTDFGTYSVNIDGNGNDIMVAATTDVDLDIDNRMFIFTWNNTASLWTINLGLLKGVV
jgi:hypothetical protein